MLVVQGAASQVVFVGQAVAVGQVVINTGVLVVTVCAEPVDCRES